MVHAWDEIKCKVFDYDEENTRFGAPKTYHRYRYESVTHRGGLETPLLISFFNTQARAANDRKAAYAGS
jgi:hypothetical protein